MSNYCSYRSSFIFALALHGLLILFLLVKITSSKPNAAFSYAHSFINATAISERDIGAQIGKLPVAKQIPLQQQKTQEPATKQQVLQPPPTAVKQPLVEKSEKVAKEQLQSLLQKNLLAEQALEMSELKKERRKRKEAVIKQQKQQEKQRRQQQLQKILREQIVAEQQELTSSKQVATKTESGVSGVDGIAASHGGGAPQAGEVNKYAALIQQAINSQWTIVGGAPGDICRVRVSVAPGGAVLKVQLLSSSGNLALERSAQAAVLKASPLPVPEDTTLFEEFRDLTLNFRPEGIVEN